MGMGGSPGSLKVVVDVHITLEDFEDFEDIEKDFEDSWCSSVIVEDFEKDFEKDSPLCPSSTLEDIEEDFEDFEKDSWRSSFRETIVRSLSGISGGTSGVSENWRRRVSCSMTST